MIQTDLYSFSNKTGTLVPWCKKCGEQNFWKNGKSEKNQQVYKCKNCGFRFVWCSDLPNKRFFTNVIAFAVEMYVEIGISLRTLAKKLKKFFNVNVSHEGIRKWVKIYEKPISRREIPVETSWHADETYIKIKGIGHWLWIVRCRETGNVLSWRITKCRFFKDARGLMQDALNVAGTRPETITTDGLYQYAAAIKKVMGWQHYTYKKKHIIDSGIGKNWFIERLNREIKRRIKWFSSFQSLEGANTFFSVWFHHLNKSEFPTQGI
ncbi:MAG: IS6 family transposase [Nanoarchaeota archaeon]|nr:IS6 family transposase [Nanoarchaeota archaeon]MBU1622814.1 IS6 family transposase [Nanoarchaeota archaeon]